MRGIQPAGSVRHWSVVRGFEPAGTETFSWERRIEHPDAWLLPIPPLAEPDGDGNKVPEEREAELVLAGGGSGTESGDEQP